jgi:hypothetical protein
MLIRSKTPSTISRLFPRDTSDGSDLEVAAAAVDGKLPHIDGFGQQAPEMHAVSSPNNFPVNLDFSGDRVSISARKSPSMTAGQGSGCFQES